MEYVGNLCSPCPLHEQPKRLIYISRFSTIQLHVCLTEESILLVTLVHVLSLTVTKVSKRNICQRLKVVDKPLKVIK